MLLSTMLQPRDTDNGVPSITAPWPVQDIIYVAIIAPIMLAAFLEWILFLVAFQYCFVQVFRKADVEHKWSVRILCVLNMIFSMLMRCIFLPIMVVTLPLPSQVVQYFPEKLVDILQWFAFVSLAWAILVLGPSLMFLLVHLCGPPDYTMATLRLPTGDTQCW